LLTATSASSGYTSATGGNDAGAAANVGAFRPDTTTYFEWTLTPAAGVSVTVGQNGAGNAGKNTANWRIDDLSVGAATSGSVPVPAIRASPSSLPPFNAVSGNPSSPQTITIGGANLSANISATVSAGFELSRDGKAAGTLKL
jgi:hypothetical protein